MSKKKGNKKEVGSIRRGLLSKLKESMSESAHEGMKDKFQEGGIKVVAKASSPEGMKKALDKAKDAIPMSEKIMKKKKEQEEEHDCGNDFRDGGSKKNKKKK
jgi:hypothetical protein